MLAWLFPHIPNKALLYLGTELCSIWAVSKKVQILHSVSDGSLGRKALTTLKGFFLDTPIVSSIWTEPESSVHGKVCNTELMSHGSKCQHRIHATISNRPLIHHASATQSCPFLSSFKKGCTLTQLCPFLAHSSTSTSRLERPLYNHGVSHSSTSEQGDD